MAGHGPPPKDPSKRARKNSDVVQLRVLNATAAPQPVLPARLRRHQEDDGMEWSEDIGWPAATVDWWALWGRAPLAPSFTETDWSELLIAAFLHAEFMEGNYKLAGELRLRTAKFGATPDDRLRLRVSLAFAENTEVDTMRKVSRRSEYRGLMASDALEA